MSSQKLLIYESSTWPIGPDDTCNPPWCGEGKEEDGLRGLNRLARAFLLLPSAPPSPLESPHLLVIGRLIELEADSSVPLPLLPLYYLCAIDLLIGQLSANEMILEVRIAHRQWFASEHSIDIGQPCVGGP